MKAKHLSRALEQLAEEGAARVFKPRMDSNWIVGVVGALQFEVLADRIRTEYEIPVYFEQTTLFTARWVDAEDAAQLKKFVDSNQGRAGRRPRRIARIPGAQFLGTGQGAGRLAQDQVHEDQRA